eukprot:gb/GECG01013853.1/.p1 GENE.gb/GECG01013853.1/~~gb/GECG01013853.1/.p1  ORF type:complete len:870 (+),score=105.76 gb/GECG01013853.1/:1-2610(+)
MSTGSDGSIPAPGFRSLPDEFRDESEFTPWHPRAIHAIQQHSIQQQLEEREHEYTDFHKIRIYTGTWNVAGKWPNEDLESWLSPEETSTRMADIYAIGLQEMVDLTASNVLMENQSVKRAAQWKEHILQILNTLVDQKGGELPSDFGKYEVIGCTHLVGILILVVVRSPLVPHISGVLDRNAGVGVMGVMGNKGGTSIRFNLYDTSFCFTSSHLAAKRGNVSARNSDFASIINKTEFQDPYIATAVQDSVPSDEPLPDSIGAYGIFDHDVVLWLGDLNYRIQENLTIPEVLELAKKAQKGDESAYKTLRNNDQLNIERARRRTFHGFLEGTLTFPPTYKYQPGTNVYEERPEKKSRAPAWCDRVLWRAGIGYREHVRQICYNRSDQVSSDHKPVYALFDVDVRVTDPEKKRAVYSDVLQKVDMEENAARPQVRLSATDIDMGSIVVGLPKTVTITLSNVGSSVAPWLFVPKLEDQWFAAPWLNVYPPYGLLQRNQSVNITISVHYSLAVSRDVSLGRTSRLDDLLVLRVKEGRDYFLAVSANPLPSAFGCSIEQLCRRKEPIRDIALSALVASQTKDETSRSFSKDAGEEEDLLGLESFDKPEVETGGSPKYGRAPATPTQMLPVPKELWWLVDALMKRNGLDKPGIFTTPGDPQELAQIRECLDQGMELPDFVSSVSIAASILQLVVSLRDPIIPVSFFPGPDLKAEHIPKYCRHVLSRVDSVRFNTLLYVIALAKEALEDVHRQRNGLTERAMLMALCRACMRKAPHDDARVHHSFISQLGIGAHNSGSPGDRGSYEAIPGGRKSFSESQMELIHKGQNNVVQQLSRCYGAVQRADPGTGWEPTSHEQSMMMQIFQYFFSMESFPNT